MTFWGSLARAARKATGRGGSRSLLGRLPAAVRGFARAVDLATSPARRTSRTSTVRPTAPAGWAPQPPGPPLEPPIVEAEIVRPAQPQPQPAQLQPAQRDMADLRRELDRPLTPDATESILDRISVLTRQLDRRKLSRRQNDALDQLEQLLTRPRRKTAAEQETEAEEIGIQLLGRGPMGYEWRDQWTAQRLKEAVYTPQSSNVYSFLYIGGQFGRDGEGNPIDKSGKLIEGAVYNQQERNRFLQALQDVTSGTGRYRTGNRQTPGGVLYVTFKLWQPGQRGERPNQPGPTYAYYDVPTAKYMMFLSKSKKSPGEAVWDYLRQRGSQHGHQHAYRLVFGAQVPHGGREVQAGGIYVPRKAVAPRTTKEGKAIRYVPRSLPAPGMGRRGIIPSQLSGPTAAMRRHMARRT